MNNRYLITAGALSCLAALVHLAVIAGGPDWYRFFGAGEQMAEMAERGEIHPALVTLAIAAVLFLWSAYAFSGAGVIKRLPFLRFGLIAITAVYLIRGLLGGVIAFIPSSLQVQQLGLSFVIWSSVICAVFGVIHLLGVYRGWPFLSDAQS